MSRASSVTFVLLCIVALAHADSNSTSTSSSNPCAQPHGIAYSYPLHIASVFIILVSSFLGAAIPIASKYATSRFHLSEFQICVGKCVGIGVVLACALVHMLQPSSESLTSPCVPYEFNTDYTAYAFLFAMLAGLAMQFFDYMVLQYFLSMQGTASETTKLEASSATGVSGETKAVGGHVHMHVLLDSAMQKTISAYLLEFGVTVHSVFIGLTVGVTDNSTLKALLVALVFHQFFEGVALGARIADATQLSRLNEIFLTAVFSVAAPFGIALGIGIISSLDANGETFLLVQGTFDGVCGGILLYIGYSLLLKDFPEDMERHCRGHPMEKYMRASMFIALWIGAGLMAFIGKYL